MKKIYTFLGSENAKGKTTEMLSKFKTIAKKEGFGFTDDLKKADALFIVTPVHWFGAPLKLKKFIDTTLHKMEENNFQAEGKFFAALVYSPEGGASLLLSQLALTANLMGFIIAPYSLIYYRDNKKDNEWAFNFYFLDYWKSNKQTKQ